MQTPIELRMLSLLGFTIGENYLEPDLLDCYSGGGHKSICTSSE